MLLPSFLWIAAMGLNGVDSAGMTAEIRQAGQYHTILRIPALNSIV